MWVQSPDWTWCMMSRSTCRINFQFDCWTPRLRKYASTISGLCKYEISSWIAVLSLRFFFQFHFQIPNFPLTGLRDAVNWRLGTMLSHFYLSSFCLIVYKFIKLGWDLTVCETYPSSHSTENVWLRVSLLQCPCKRRGWSSRFVSCEFRIQGSTPYSRTMARNQSLWVLHFLDQRNVVIIFAATSPLQIISNSSSSKREIEKKVYISSDLNPIDRSVDILQRFKIYRHIVNIGNC